MCDGCAEWKKLMHVRFAELQSPFDFFKHRPSAILNIRRHISAHERITETHVQIAK